MFYFPSNDFKINSGKFVVPVVLQETQRSQVRRKDLSTTVSEIPERGLERSWLCSIEVFEIHWRVKGCRIAEVWTSSQSSSDDFTRFVLIPLTYPSFYLVPDAFPLLFDPR